MFTEGLPSGSVVKNPPANKGDMGSNPGLGKFLGESSLAIFLPGESHGQRSLAGHSPWGHKESDTTLYIILYIHHIFFTYSFINGKLRLFPYLGYSK